jgi:hypothetical protein
MWPAGLSWDCSFTVSKQLLIERFAKKWRFRGESGIGSFSKSDRKIFLGFQKNLIVAGLNPILS